MGLFSRRRSVTDDADRSKPKLYVFIRCTDTFSSKTAEWSLAVSGNTISPSTQPDGKLDESKKSRSAFTTPNHSTSNFDRQLTSASTSTSGSISESSSHRSTSNISNTCREFTFRSGNFVTIEHESVSAAKPDPTANPASLLIKILLPHTTSPKSKPKLKRNPPNQHSLAQQLEHLLRPSAISTPDSKTWLHTSLTQLQKSSHLPAPPSFHVAKFLEFAHNHLLAFRSELRSGTQQTHPRTKEVDYAAHQRENERLKEMFGHGPSAESPALAAGFGGVAQGAQQAWDFRGVMQGGDAFWLGGGNGSGMQRSPGKWWISYPMGEDRVAGAGRNVYGGLM